jgi:mannose-6-phosphate isomerase-like protein (cupin superfamily)
MLKKLQSKTQLATPGPAIAPQAGIDPSELNPKRLARSSSAYRDSGAHGPVSRENAEHYRWGIDCDAWYLVNDEQLSVIEEFMPPGAAEIRHHHSKAQQFFYIVSGEVLMEVEGETVLLGAGSGIRVLPGKKHQIRNPSSVPVRFLVISHPRSHGDRIDE